MFKEVKRPERKAGRSPQTSAKVKKSWIYASTPPYVFMSMCFLSTMKFYILQSMNNIVVLFCKMSGLENWH
jgi:hypothetical protein